MGNEHVPYINPDASANGFDDDAFCEEGDIVLTDASEDLDDVGKAIEIVSLDGERVVAGTHTILATRRGSVPVVGFGGQLFQSATVRAGDQERSSRREGLRHIGKPHFGCSGSSPTGSSRATEDRRLPWLAGRRDRGAGPEDRSPETAQAGADAAALSPGPARPCPRLRFPEFRDDPTWLAQQLDDLYDFKRTNTLSRDKLNYETGTIRNIHYGDIHTKFKPLFRVGNEHVPYINPDASANGFDDDAFCEEGDIVLADASRGPR